MATLTLFLEILSPGRWLLRSFNKSLRNERASVNLQHRGLRPDTSADSRYELAFPKFVRIRSAIAIVPLKGISGRTITNSSPPYLPAKSVSRTVLLKTGFASARAWLTKRCSKVSLIQSHPSIPISSKDTFFLQR